ncbi:hypothetical protein CKAH01_03270 [Colletotrichum kahawae]|uniref:Uncharacterized protein n=1 Tax=Colletotrichum kahawae TaxID=34407 RepID=A0AAD9YUL2_COLKA|nr:hypothetical protein CKAH01_03270 [Colletotrichum kahawae]
MLPPLLKQQSLPAAVTCLLLLQTERMPSTWLTGRGMSVSGLPSGPQSQPWSCLWRMECLSAICLVRLPGLG